MHPSILNSLSFRADKQYLWMSTYRMTKCNCHIVSSSAIIMMMMECKLGLRSVNLGSSLQSAMQLIQINSKVFLVLLLDIIPVT